MGTKISTTTPSKPAETSVKQGDLVIPIGGAITQELIRIVTDKGIFDLKGEWMNDLTHLTTYTKLPIGTKITLEVTA